MNPFTAKIFIIGINPYVLVPVSVLKELFEQSGKTTSPISVKGSLNGKKFQQTLVKYAGKWRLYLNAPMRLAAGIDVGDTACITLFYDPAIPPAPTNPALQQALTKNKKAGAIFKNLPPYYQKEIARYLNGLKTKEALERNIGKAIQHLLGKERFIGREPVADKQQHK